MPSYTITNPEASALEEIGKVFVRLHNKTSLRRGDAPQDLETLTSTLCECVTGIFARTLNKVATCFSFIEYYSFLEGAPERLKTTTTTTTTTAQPLFNRNLDSLSGNFFG